MALFIEELLLGRQYGGSDAVPGPKMLGLPSMRVSIPRLRTSLMMLEGGLAVCSPIIVCLKKTFVFVE